MSKPTYEIDDQGNLVEKNAPATTASEDEDREVAPEDARLFLRAVVLGDVIGVVVFLGAALLLPNVRTQLLLVAAAYGVLGVAMFFYLRRDIYGRIKHPD
jgi:hypothetical protein